MNTFVVNTFVVVVVMLAYTFVAAVVMFALTGPVSASDDRGPKVVFSLQQNAVANTPDAARHQVLAAERGEIITVALQSGPGSGYKWELAAILSTDMGDPLASVKTGGRRLQNSNADETALKELPDVHAMEPFHSRHVRLGQTSHQLFKFEATAAGNSILRFEYKQAIKGASQTTAPSSATAAPSDTAVVEVRVAHVAEREHAKAGDEEDLLLAVVEEEEEADVAGDEIDGGVAALSKTAGLSSHTRSQEL